MATKEEWKNFQWLMFGLIAGGGFSFFGNFYVAAYFADKSNPARSFWLSYSLGFLALFFIVSVIIFLYSARKAK